MSTIGSIGRVLLIGALGVLCACSASKNITESQSHLQRVDDYRTVRIDSMATFLEEYRKQQEDEVLYQLEYGALHHYRENWEESTKYFKQAERSIEKNYTKSINRNLQAMLTNDLQLAYKGEAYEDIYLNTFSCLNFLHQGDVDGALVEARRVTHKLENLTDRYKGLAGSVSRDTAQEAVSKVDEKLEGIDLLGGGGNDGPIEIEQNSAFGRFLTTVLYSNTGSPTSAEIELKQLHTALQDQGHTGFLDYFDQPYAREEPALAGRRVTNSMMLAFPTMREFVMQDDDYLDYLDQIYVEGQPAAGQQPESDPDSVTVEVPKVNDLPDAESHNALLLSFSGKPPRKEERSFEFDLEISGEDVELNFSVPILELPGTRVGRVRAIVAGDTLRVPLLEDMQSVAESMFDKKKSIIYTRAVIRSILKAGATEGASELAENQMGETAGFITKVAGEAISEGLAQADTRAWQTMPGFTYAAVAKLPPGEHEVTFEYLPEPGLPDAVITVSPENEGETWVVTEQGRFGTSHVRRYDRKAEAVNAARPRARAHVPSQLIVMNAYGSVVRSESFDIFKRRTQTVSVNGPADLDVAESIYLH